jgi:hypothetical protein
LNPRSAISELHLKMFYAAPIRWRYLWILLVTVALAGCEETFTINARNYQEWKTLSENAKSFFPNNLPSSAHDIHARHEPDTLATNVAFEVGLDSLADFERSFKQIAPSEVVWPRMLVNEPWCPAALITVPLRKLNARDWNFLRTNKVRDGVNFVGVVRSIERR